MDSAKFPQDPILVRLVAISQRVTDPPPMIHDVMGFSKGYPHLLGDILATRRRLLQQLPDTLVLEAQQLLRSESSPYIFLLCQSGYEYLVGFFAIRALGGAVMPLAPGILPAEAVYLAHQTQASCLVFGKDSESKADAIRVAIHAATNPSLPVAFTSCAVSTDAEPQDAASVAIDDSQPLSESGPGLVMLTSGTSGPPKAAVLPRRALATEQLAPPGGAGLNCRPGHYIGALDGMMEPILTGQSLYCIGQRASTAELLQAFVAHRITHALFSPLVLARMRDLILKSSSSSSSSSAPTDSSSKTTADVVLSDEIRAKYGSVFRGMSRIMAGGATMSPALRDFWSDLTGLPVENFYASTEAGIRASSCLDGQDGCIGISVEGVDMKLSQEPVGEILLRSATMFTHYIGDEKATRAAFDQDGFLKTGDVGKLHNGQYYILGRENLDVIRMTHLCFAAEDVERALLALPGVSEACVVGVSVRGRAQMCGAVIRIKSEAAADMPLLGAVRKGLRDIGGLPVYMLPVLLRVLADDEALPLTQTGKTAKGAVRTAFFAGAAEIDSPACLPKRVQVWHALPASDEMGTFKGDAAVKAWDWGGMQSV